MIWMVSIYFIQFIAQFHTQWAFQFHASFHVIYIIKLTTTASYKTISKLKLTNSKTEIVFFDPISKLMIIYFYLNMKVAEFEFPEALMVYFRWLNSN